MKTKQGLLLCHASGPHQPAPWVPCNSAMIDRHLTNIETPHLINFITKIDPLFLLPQSSSDMRRARGGTCQKRSSTHGRSKQKDNLSKEMEDDDNVPVICRTVTVGSPAGFHQCRHVQATVRRETHGHLQIVVANQLTNYRECIYLG